MKRTLWIVAGCLALTAAIVGVALVAFDQDAAPGAKAGEATGERIVAGAETGGQDKAAQSDLEEAMAVAKTFSADNGGYTGFDSEWASSLDPGLAFSSDGPARTGAVTINLARGNEVVMSTLSASGQALCISDDASISDPTTLNEGLSFGSVDAHGVTAASDCTGSW